MADHTRAEPGNSGPAMARIFLAAVTATASLLLGAEARAAEPAATGLIDLTHHVVGYWALAITALAYVAAMTEDVTALRKSKPMLLGAALAWLGICAYYAAHGQAQAAATAFEANLLTYVELLLFILVSMSYLNAMEDRGVFDALRTWLLNRSFSYRQMFWITGLLAFALSTVVSGLAVGLLMGAVVAAVGRAEPKFTALACVNLVVATNAGGSCSPLGGISTLLVWQSGLVQFHDFLSLSAPCLIMFLVPALVFHWFVPRVCPLVPRREVRLRRGGGTLLVLFGLTLAMTVCFTVILKLPPAGGMMMGLALLQFFGFYLSHTAAPTLNGLHGNGDPQAASHQSARESDVFQSIGKIEWDTLLFFYGAMMLIGALGFIGYLDGIAHFLFGQTNPTAANILIGLASAFVDNGTLMFAVLSMHPDIPLGQWLLLTLTLGTGGSLLAIGSAPGVALLGEIKGRYTFAYHLRWFPVILAGYVIGIGFHFWINARYF